MKGIGPGPYAGMLLADLGAEVIVVERSSDFVGIGPAPQRDIHSRGKRSIALDIKSDEGRDALLQLIDSADALIEGYRPGVAERLGFGPDVCLERHARLVYGRVTGWGQTGPLANAAGHDINYISLSGALAAIGNEAKPTPPLNLVGDYAGGSLFLVMGVLAALLHVRGGGSGQVIDAAITDGSASLMSMFHTLHALAAWNPRRGANLLDGGAHFYNVYATADDKFISIGSIEPQFYALLVDKAGLDPEAFGGKQRPGDWPGLGRRLASVFRSKTRDEWCALLEGTDVCFAPVLDYLEAPRHSHNRARETYVEIDGLEQPAPAPRFSHSVCERPSAPHAAGADSDRILAELGFGEREIARLREKGVVR